MIDKLKSCPFCGGKVELMTLLTGVKMFYCRNYYGCGAIVSFNTPDCDREKGDGNKIRHWNRRSK